MKKLLTVTALALVLATNAYAGNCNGLVNCNNQDNDFVDVDNTNKAYGGDAEAKALGVGVGIGYGGAGGDATAYGGAGGKAIQGQQQGQIGINKNDIDIDNKQKQYLDNDIDNKNYNKNYNAPKAYGGDGGKAIQGQIGINKQGQDQDQDQKQKQGQDQKQRQKTDVDVNNKVSNSDYTNIGIQFAARKREASSAIAAALVANGCFGSLSAGVQGTIFGASVGGTTESENCIALRTSARFQELSDYYFLLAGSVKMPPAPVKDEPVSQLYAAAESTRNMWVRTGEAWEQAAHNALCEDELSRNAFRGIELLQCEEDGEPTVRNYASTDSNKGDYYMMRKKR